MDLLLLSRRGHKEDLLRREKCNAMGGGRAKEGAIFGRRI